MQKNIHRPQNNIQRNFEFLYFGSESLDKPFTILEQLGGIESDKIQFEGEDIPEEGPHRGFSFSLRVFDFPGHSIQAYCTREERPQHSQKPKYITRIRLGNYEKADEFTREVSEALKNLPSIFL